jgi:hypothetical protein
MKMFKNEEEGVNPKRNKENWKLIGKKVWLGCNALKQSLILKSLQIYPINFNFWVATFERVDMCVLRNEAYK